MTRELYCHDCDAVRPVRRRTTFTGRRLATYECRTCGGPIVCDECGDEWTLTHDRIHWSSGAPSGC